MRLHGTAPPPGFVEDLRERFESDPFVRDVVIAAVCDEAFAGRVPTRRPAGATWDRGLTWWAAVIAGVSVTEFEARSSVASVTQRVLFEEPPPPPLVRAPRRPSERAALVRGLHELLEAADGEQVPAAAVRQLLGRLEQGRLA